MDWSSEKNQIRQKKWISAAVQHTRSKQLYLLVKREYLLNQRFSKCGPGTLGPLRHPQRSGKVKTIFTVLLRCCLHLHSYLPMSIQWSLQGASWSVDHNRLSKYKTIEDYWSQTLRDLQKSQDNSTHLTNCFLLQTTNCAHFWNVIYVNTQSVYYCYSTVN